LEQPQTPDRPDLVNANANGPVDTPTPPISPPPPETNEAAPATALPLTPMAWLSQNGIYLLIIAAIVGTIYYFHNFEGVIKAAIVVLGLGFVVFVHELGHFLAAKWCDVHVQTFSLGFGPAIPGCSFRRGETLYKIAILPLGGYVAMVGEGTEADENEDYPRSFKNKSVGQRMVIISAGVIMNMILGFLCFIGIFYFPGLEKPKGIVSTVEPGSPAWRAEFRSGSRFTRIGNRENPNFQDLQMRVASTWFYSKIHIELQPRPGDGPPMSVDLEPRRTENDVQPVIGVGSPTKLQLPSEKLARFYERPVVYGSAAAKARVIELLPGQAVVSAKAAESTDKLQASDGKSALSWDDVCRFISKHPKHAITLEVSPQPTIADKPRTSVILPVDGFHFGDKIVGTTDDAQAGPGYDPFVMKQLPLDPFDESNENYDPFEFHKRIRRLAGRPVVIQVHREGQTIATPPVNLLVPPSYTPTTGMIMQKGRVAAIRNNSSAAKAHVQEGDTITRIEMLGTYSDDAMHALRVANPTAALLLANAKEPYVCADFNDTDPARLPFDLERAANQMTGPKWARITVQQSNQNPEAAGEDPHRASKPVVLEPVEWDEKWDNNIETPSKPSSPLSIPQLGVAYWINCRVKAVQPGSPAANAGILPDDRIAEIRWRVASNKEDDANKSWSKWLKLQSKRENGRVEYDEWAWCALTRRGDYDEPSFQVKVVRDGKVVQEGDKDKEFELDTHYDLTWPSDNLGFLFLMDTTNVKAKSLWDALELGTNETWDWVLQIYLGMRNLLTGRIDPIQSFGGPIAIAKTAFTLADDLVGFIRFMAIISINLAIVNFLPIPLLDGGHMVLLIYEKIRGKPPSDFWKAVLTYAGAIIVLGLMVAAFGLDFAKEFGWL
jgi:RIP metalloprotease RseP